MNVCQNKQGGRSQDQPVFVVVRPLCGMREGGRGNQRRGVGGRQRRRKGPFSIFWFLRYGPWSSIVCTARGLANCLRIMAINRAAEWFFSHRLCQDKVTTASQMIRLICPQSNRTNFMLPFRIWANDVFVRDLFAVWTSYLLLSPFFSFESSVSLPFSLWLCFRLLFLRLLRRIWANHLFFVTYSYLFRCLALDELQQINPVDCSSSLLSFLLFLLFVYSFIRPSIYSFIYQSPLLRIWANYISFVTYWFRGLALNELQQIHNVDLSA